MSNGRHAENGMLGGVSIWRQDELTDLLLDLKPVGLCGDNDVNGTCLLGFAYRPPFFNRRQAYWIYPHRNLELVPVILFQRLVSAQFASSVARKTLSEYLHGSIARNRDW